MRPETASKAPAAKSHRPKPRPISQDTIAPSTAPPGTHWGDHVAHPVDEIQERPFWLGARFALNRHVGLGRCPEALC